MAFPKKISELPVSGALSNADLLAIVNAGVTSKTTLGEIAAILSGSSFSWSDPIVTAGNTSGDCIDQLWVHAISGCSPVLIGDAKFLGSTNIDGDLIINQGIHISEDVNTVVKIPTYICNNCNDDTDVMTLTQNLSEYIGKTVTFAEIPDKCWNITLQPTLEVTGSWITDEGGCVECSGPESSNNKYTACEPQECEFNTFITDPANVLIDSGLFNFNCCWYYVDELTSEPPTEYSPGEDEIFPMDLECEQAIVEFTTFEINPCEGTEGFTRYMNCYDGIRPGDIVKIEDDLEEGCWMVVGPSNETEPIASFVSVVDGGCEDVSCPGPGESELLSFQPGEEEGIVEVYYSSEVEISGFNMQFRPGFTVIDATGIGGAAGTASWTVSFQNNVPLGDGETETSKVGMWSFAGSTIPATGIGEDVLLCTLTIMESNEGVTFDNPISTARWTTMENNIGADDTKNDYFPDDIIDVIDITVIWNDAMSNYFGVAEVGSQFVNEGSDYEPFLVSGPETGGLELLVGTANCMLGLPIDTPPVCSLEEPLASNYVTFEDYGEGSISIWPIT